MDDRLMEYHPMVQFVFFAAVLAGTMTLRHPVAQLLSLVGGLLYILLTEGRAAIGFVLRFALPLLLVAALINPMFSHEGVTILTYLPSGNPLTLESLLYGLSSGLMLATVLLWFRSLQRVMTSEKFVYLFGRLLPALALMLSMTLRLIPLFAKRFRLVREAQQGLGVQEEASLLRRLRGAIRELSIMITWSLENAIDTADSMKGRGYGLPGRTAFSIYRWEERDRAALAWVLGAAGYVLLGGLAKGLAFYYFPMLQMAAVTPLTVSFLVVYAALVLTPAYFCLRNRKRIAEAKEEER